MVNVYFVWKAPGNLLRHGTGGPLEKSLAAVCRAQQREYVHRRSYGLELSLITNSIRAPDPMGTAMIEYAMVHVSAYSCNVQTVF